MELPKVLNNDNGIRPAGKPDECFYCNQKVGEPHKADCVILHKKVKVKYTFEIEVEVPHHWDKHDVEFHRNDSSWCADNSFEEIESHAKKHGCICHAFECEVTEMPEMEPYRRNDKGEVVS